MESNQTKSEREKKEHSRTKPALNLLSQVKQMVEVWNAECKNRQHLVLTLGPSMHLVQRSFDELQQWAQEKGLHVCRHQIPEDEKKKFVPTLPQKVARYYVKIATTNAAAEMPPSTQDKQMAFLKPQKIAPDPGNGNTGAGDKKRKRSQEY